MTGALIGLVGVVAGALLGGLLTFGVEASKRRKTAYAAGSLIATELTVVIDTMKSAIPESGAPQRWTGDLPTRAWDVRAADLVLNGIPASFPGAPETLDPRIEKLLALCGPTDPSPPAIPATQAQAQADLLSRRRRLLTPRKPSHSSAERPDLFTRLGEVYASIDIWNSKPGDPEQCALVREIQFYSTVRGDLKRYTRSLARRGRTSFRRAASVALAIAVSVIAVILLITPRADVNSATVATALENHLDGTNVVQCEPSGVRDWQCIVYHLSEPLSACGTGVVASGTAADDAVVELAVQRGSCAEVAPPTPYGVQDDGPELMVVHETPAVARERPEDRRLQFSASTYGIPEPSTSPWGKIINWFKGH